MTGPVLLGGPDLEMALLPGLPQVLLELHEVEPTASITRDGRRYRVEVRELATRLGHVFGWIETTRTTRGAARVADRLTRAIRARRAASLGTR